MTSPISSGFVYGGGNTKRWLEDRIAKAVAAFNALSPEEQAAHRQAQKESWVRGEMGIGNDAQEAAARAAWREVNNPPKPHVSGPTKAETPTMLPTPQQMGFTGNTCTYCQGTRMKQTGHCETCQDCGETTACA